MISAPSRAGSFLPALFIALASVASLTHAAPGDLDTTWGIDGKATLDLGPDSTVVAGLGLDPNGRVLVSHGQGLARLLPDGSVDPAFGPLRPPSDAYFGHYEFLPDGRMLIVSSARYDRRMWRVGLDGSIDRTFGYDGWRSVGELKGFWLLDDGRMAYTGGNESNPHFGRLTSAGDPDPTFAPDGKRSLSFPFYASLAGLVVQPDGKWLVNAWTATETGQHVMFLRFNADGTDDTSYGVGGRTLVDSHPVPGNYLMSIASSPMLQPDGGSIVVASAARQVDSPAPNTMCIDYPGAHDFYKRSIQMIGLDSRGQPSSAFGFGGRLTNFPGDDETTAWGAMLDAEGRIIVMGSRRSWPDCVTSTYVARFTAQGTLDPNFGTGGIRNLPTNVTARSFAVMPDGAILVLTGNGSTFEPAFATYRLLGDHTTQFAPGRDRDHDGIPDAVEPSVGGNPDTKDNNIFANYTLFAMQLYRDFLGREGDPAGVAFWAGRTGSRAVTRAQAIESFFTSAEFQGTIAPVARLYFAYFLRIPDYSGLNFWIGYFRAGNSLDAISNGFAGSAEFQSNYGALDNGQFVDLVYQNVLGRPADAGGLAFWKHELDTGARTRGQVMLGFSESEEYRGSSDSMVYVTMMYFGMMRRAPDQQGFDFWVGYRNSGNSGLALIDAFLGSQEYHNRFLP